MTLLLLPILLAAQQAAPGGPAADAVELELRMRVLPLAEDADEPPSERLLRVEVGAGRAWLRSEDSELLYDFGALRRFTLDRAAGTYVSDSLFASLHFRDREMAKRERMRADLGEEAAAQIERLSLVLAEQDLSVRSAAAHEPVQRIAGAGGVRFVWQGNDLAFVAAERLDVPARARDDFVRFLRWHVRGHPLALEEIENGRGIPRLLRLDFRGVDDRAIEIETLALRTVAAPPDALAGMQRTWEGPLRLTAPIRAAHAMAPWDIQQAVDEREARAQAAFAGGALLAARLHTAEGEAMTGLPLPLSHDARVAAYKADPKVASYLHAVAARDTEERRAAMATLAALRREQPELAHVLAYFEAVQRAEFGDLAGANGLLLLALEREPRLAAAWKRLGEVIASDLLLTSQAWACWEAGRAACPESSQLDFLGREEERLMGAHPEYF